MRNSPSERYFCISAFTRLIRPSSPGWLRYASGIIRWDIGKIDLEAYDYKPGSQSGVRPTEGTVESRLPPRIRVRQDAPLELPHVMVLIGFSIPPRAVSA